MPSGSPSYRVLSARLARSPPRTHILHPALRVKPQILVQPKPDIVPVEPIRVPAEMQQVLLERRGDRRLARGREAREPDGGALLREELGALGLGDSAWGLASEVGGEGEGEGCRVEGGGDDDGPS
jgi:hypothetical protein